MLLWVAFEVLNLNFAPMTAVIPVRPRIIDGLFQATGVRTSGAYIITISSLAPALLILYLIFIYVSSFPIIRESALMNQAVHNSLILQYSGSSPDEYI